MKDIITSDEISQSIVTRNSADFYFEKFNLGTNGEYLQGKMILDVGSGQSNFAEVINNNTQLNATVVSLDAKYSELKPQYLNQTVIGVSQFLPFADNTFGDVVASYSIFWIKEKLPQALMETIRVTKPGGKIQIYPATLIDLKGLEDFPQFALDFREGEKESGYTLTITKNPEITATEWEQVIQTLCERISFSTEPTVKMPSKEELTKKLRQALY